MLQGKLVRLRPLEPEDVDRYVAWFNDAEVTLFLSQRYPWSRAAELEFLRQRSTKPMGLDDLALAIERLDGLHIGSVGIHGVHAEDRKATFGIVIGDKSCWGQGYGTDATRTILRFAFD